MKTKLIAFSLILVVLVACNPAPAEPIATRELAAEETQTASPTRTLSPSPTPTPETGLVLEDDFSDPNSGLGEWDFDYFAGSYINGEFSLRLNDPRAIGAGLYPDSYTDVRLETIVELSDENAYAGLVCRATDGDNYYVGLVGKEDYALGMLVDGSPVSFANGAVDNTTFATGQELRLGLECDGMALRLYVNGVLVGSALDANLAAGMVGLAIVSSEIPLEGLFDDFQLVDLLVAQDHLSSPGSLEIRAYLDTGETVEGLQISLDRLGFAADAMTDANGTATIAELAPDDYPISLIWEVEMIAPASCENPDLLYWIRENRLTSLDLATGATYVSEYHFYRDQQVVTVIPGENTIVELEFGCEG